MNRFRELVASERPLVLPGAHDALSALLIRQTGFKAFFIGGFPVAGVRHGLPDLGLLGLREFADAYRDILAVTDLPALVDADNGYGDVKNVVHTVRTLEALGAQALFFEDQVSPKRCGHIAGKAIVPAQEMAAKIRAAASERSNPDTFLIARTDAREVVGLDEALRRGEQYLRAGADGLFIESPMSVEEMARIGREFDVPLLANMLEGGRTPILRPAQLEELGFRIVIYGISLLMRATASMRETLADIASGELRLSGTGVSFDDYKRIVGIDEWTRIEDSYKA
ncbi:MULTISPECIES: isocitrate lyase/PEP mutase family protein [Ramlibacter]|uniref:2,3-dimethylmalate lyase n=1 Tax=Ramlibacter pinisoli TaxID=2682844 RepID=A0A6N8IYU3_9BURK|nr:MULTISPECIES: isocitrate lyase/PEP mutase family protein [Ramlibacter]MBA2961814.1 isocitrate lyase/PEP mutase family protein [Ramlibacter sp. CGMCC 1.13660]MVQ31755.1 2,3-dimethylmalate lyase [Ramlibacter pinisoli]